MVINKRHTHKSNEQEVLLAPSENSNTPEISTNKNQ